MWPGQFRGAHRWNRSFFQTRSAGRAILTPRSSFYSYYAGFAPTFARAILREIAAADEEGLVLDPWNGAGTTTVACAELGLKARGGDLNPVMVVVAKGRLLASNTAPSVLPLASRIVEVFDQESLFELKDDPLGSWFCGVTVRHLRALEGAVFQTLVNNSASMLGDRVASIVRGSDLASFFYIGLFNTVRKLLESRRTSNPTWLEQRELGAGKSLLLYRPHSPSIHVFNGVLVGMCWKRQESEDAQPKTT